MSTVKAFTFNPFQENTYIISDSTGECVIIDPGCFESSEKKELVRYIKENNLKPVKLLNTHAHIDHVLGNRFVAETWSLGLEMHRDDLVTLHSLPNYAHIFGVGTIEESPEPAVFLEEGDQIRFGDTTLDILFVPGHAPGHIAIVNRKEKYVVSGDVLFAGSIGRTDLPGGSMKVLMESIHNKIVPLGAEFVVYSGHGPETTIERELRENYFLQPGIADKLS
jgi:hydroxyacylglutathione hydrolase